MEENKAIASVLADSIESLKIVDVQNITLREVRGFAAFAKYLKPRFQNLLDMLTSRKVLTAGLAIYLTGIMNPYAVALIIVFVITLNTVEKCMYIQKDIKALDLAAVEAAKADTEALVRISDTLKKK